MVYRKLTVHPMQNYGTNKKIIGRARVLRKKMTEAENILWNALRRKQMKGKHFRKQHPLAGYIVDFFCHECNLVIEVDGEIHRFQQEEDEIRTEKLESFGLTVIRFSNHQVLNQLDHVKHEIAQYL